MLGRQVISAEEAKAIDVNPSYFKDTSDAIFMTSRGDHVYDRTFMSGFIWPGIGAQNWVSRTTYPALNVVQTGPSEMSLYANQNYASYPGPTYYNQGYAQYGLPGVGVSGGVDGVEIQISSAAVPRISPRNGGCGDITRGNPDRCRVPARNASVPRR